jgi:photosystem II stability/assembly factor-like uncharacterized protein
VRHRTEAFHPHPDSRASNDGRPNFDSIVPDAKNVVLYSAARYPSSSDPVIFRSTDGGVKWNPASRGVTGAILALRGDAAGALLALGTEGGLWRSADGATNWSAVGSGLPSKDLKALAIDPTNPSRVYVAAKDGLYESVDGGATFALAGKGLEKQELEGVVLDGKGNAYVASGDGVHRSTDGGKSWTAFNDGLTNEDVRALHSAGTRLYAGTAVGGVFSIDLE